MQKKLLVCLKNIALHGVLNIFRLNFQFTHLCHLMNFCLPEIMKINILQQLLWQIGAGAYPANNNSIKDGLKK